MNVRSTKINWRNLSHLISRRYATVSNNSFVLCGIQKSAHRGAYRWYSTVQTAHRPVENVEVQCGSSGSITLNIVPPLSSELFSSTIIYLPSGPVSGIDPAVNSRILAALSASSDCTIVSINYRAGSDAKYPVPIHDVLFGYNWLAKCLDEVHSSESKGRRIGVCGQLLGGSLGTMLSLTESGPLMVTAEPTGIVAAALNNPIVDWVVPDREMLECRAALPGGLEIFDEDAELRPKKTKKRKKMSSWTEHKNSKLLPESAILLLRKSIFSNNNAYFDSFASPIHFFRAPGMDVPREINPLDVDSDTEDGPELRRKSSKIFPPSDSKAQLPSFRLTTGESSIFRSQVEELLERTTASEMRNYLRPRQIGLAQYSKMDDGSASEVDFIRDKAEEKHTLSLLRGEGLWGVGDDALWQSDIQTASRWLKSVLTA